MVGRMGQSTHALVVQYPRGRGALVWLDPGTRQVSTDQAGLRLLFERGVKDWEGRLLFPRDGHTFLVAVHDHLFLNGYRTRWARIQVSDRPICHDE